MAPGRWDSRGRPALHLAHLGAPQARLALGSEYEQWSSVPLWPQTVCVSTCRPRARLPMRGLQARLSQRGATPARNTSTERAGSMGGEKEFTQVLGEHDPQ